MASRLELQSRLEEILGSRNVYFQPPESVKMSYPAIVYELSDVRPVRADNGTYLRHKRYMVKVIDKNPDSTIPEAIENGFEYWGFDRFFKSDNLNHFVYTIFY